MNDQLIDLLKEARVWVDMIGVEFEYRPDEADDCVKRLDAAIAEIEAAPERKPEIPHECRHCDCLDKHGPLVPQGRPFCEQFRFCPPVEAYRHFGCTAWQPREVGR